MVMQLPGAQLRRSRAVLAAVLLASACVPDEDISDEEMSSSGLCACAEAIALTVLDAETGARIPYATASAAGAGTCSTGASGSDCLLGNGEGGYAITVEAEGYETQVLEVYVSSLDEPGCPCSYVRERVSVYLIPSAGSSP